MLAQITWVLANRPMKRNMEGLIRSALYRSQLCSATSAVPKGFPRKKRHVTSENSPAPSFTPWFTSGGAGTHTGHGRTRAHGSHRRTSQPSKPTNPRPSVAASRPAQGRPLAQPGTGHSHNTLGMLVCCECLFACLFCCVNIVEFAPVCVTPVRCPGCRNENSACDPCL